MNSKLIILRGPSGSGKSTVAVELQKRSNRKIIILEQDYYRNTILNNQENARELSARMIINNALLLLDAGYDVITDGIFNIKHYKSMFDDLLKKHPKENYMFYFDVGLEETLRRHSGRKKADEFGKKEMTEWYSSASPMGYKFEQKIPETWELEETITHIREAAKI